jgi:hypothetical protein
MSHITMKGVKLHLVVVSCTKRLHRFINIVYTVHVITEYKVKKIFEPGGQLYVLM